MLSSLLCALRELRPVLSRIDVCCLGGERAVAPRGCQAGQIPR